LEKKVSLKDVARQAGVSIASVSYVINNKEKEGRVGVNIAEKIRKVAAELNYQPNFIAKSLKSGKTKTIGLIVADISNPFFSNIARIIEDEAKQHGYIVIFGSSDENTKNLQDLIDVFINRQVDAFIIAPTANAEKQIEFLQKMNVPVVLIDRYFPGIDTDCVHINNFAAAYSAVEHLIKVGRRKIAIVTYDTTLPHMQDRKNGYKAAMKAHGVLFENEWVIKADYKNIHNDVSTGISNLLYPAVQIDALFFTTNSLAVEGLKKINEIGIKVPDQLAVISFDQSDAFDFFYSPVTYVSQSLLDVGKEAVKLVINRINDNKKETINIIVESKLVLRDSCGRNLDKTRL
jgi:LacI family transcriptional regulator